MSLDRRRLSQQATWSADWPCCQVVGCLRQPRRGARGQRGAAAIPPARSRGTARLAAILRRRGPAAGTARRGRLRLQPPNCARSVTTLLSAALRLLRRRNLRQCSRQRARSAHVASLALPPPLARAPGFLGAARSAVVTRRAACQAGRRHALPRRPAAGRCAGCRRAAPVPGCSANWTTTRSRAPAASAALAQRAGVCAAGLASSLTVAAAPASGVGDGFSRHVRRGTCAGAVSPRPTPSACRWNRQRRMCGTRRRRLGWRCSVYSARRWRSTELFSCCACIAAAASRCDAGGCWAAAWRCGAAAQRRQNMMAAAVDLQVVAQRAIEEFPISL